MLISVRDIVRWSDSTTVFCSMRMSCNLLKVLKEYHILSNVVIVINFFFLQVSVQIKWTLIFLANLKKGFDVHKKYHLHCQQEKARHELSVSKDYGNIMPYILQETPANFICISMHFSSFVCIKNRTKWIASKKEIA